MTTPERPKLRPLDLRWVQQNGLNYLYLRDPLGLSDHTVLVPEPLVYLLALCDGSRDIEGIRIAFQLEAGISLPATQVKEIITTLSGALLLQDDRYLNAEQELLTRYRAAPHRPLALADSVYPSDPSSLKSLLSGYCAQNGSIDTKTAPLTFDNGDIVGIISPHIDYQRGWQEYSNVWKASEQAVRDAEIAIIFGTDHSGSPSKLTLTRQDYATPLGVLPSELKIIGSLEDALGAEYAYEEEIHHAREHSIELAITWLHYLRDGSPCPVVPVLCGSFHRYYSGESDSQAAKHLNDVIEVLRQHTAGRKTVVVAAGDLAHVGPTFGDTTPLDSMAKSRLAEDDREMLGQICTGGHEGLLSWMVQNKDRNRICGFPPIYMALRLLEGHRGTITGYQQCPADEHGTSVVSISGVLLEPQGRPAGVRSLSGR